MADAPLAGGPTIRAFSMPGRKPRGEWRAAAVEVGTRSTCALTLNDPVVAERHCTFRAHGDGFAIEDLGSVTGTWHNGIAVTKPVPLATGDQVVIGVTRLTVEVQQDGGEAALEIVVEEASFHYKKPKPGEFHTDADEWVRSEVRFGRVAAVRGTAWLAGVAAVLLFGWTFATASGERLLQPGALDGTHGDRAKFHGTCSVCHTGPEPGSVASCVQCHVDMAGRHPFLTLDPDRDARLDPAVEKPANACRLCHAVGHGGLDAARSTQQGRDEVKRQPEPADVASGVCRECHVDGLPGEEQLLAKAGALARKLVESTPAGAVPHVYGFEEFSHKAHAEKRRLACTVCHATGAGATAGAEFALPKFAVCAACHVEWTGKSELAVPQELDGVSPAELAALRGELRRGGLLRQLAWHGAGDRCFDCHAVSASGDPAPERATVSRQVVAHTFRVVRMGHRQHVPDLGSPADCRSCHGDLQSLEPSPEGKVQPFLHGSHVEELRPATDERKRKLSAERCGTCHASVAASTALDAHAEVAVEQACRECHVGPAAAAEVQAVSAVPGKRAVDTAPKFSHAGHAQLAGGCFECHGFGTGADDGARAAPELLAGVEDCSRCHAGHRNIAGGACALCHKAAPFGREQPVRSDWPSASKFDHNAPGHRDHVFPKPGDGKQGCVECHDRPGMGGVVRRVEQANVVSEVPPPDARGWLCLECHATRRTRFHWELPDTPRK